MSSLVKTCSSCSSLLQSFDGHQSCFCGLGLRHPACLTLPQAEVPMPLCQVGVGRPTVGQASRHGLHPLLYHRRLAVGQGHPSTGRFSPAKKRFKRESLFPSFLTVNCSHSGTPTSVLTSAYRDALKFLCSGPGWRDAVVAGGSVHVPTHTPSPSRGGHFQDEPISPSVLTVSCRHFASTTSVFTDGIRDESRVHSALTQDAGHQTEIAAFSQGN